MKKKNWIGWSVKDNQVLHFKFKSRLNKAIAEMSIEQFIEALRLMRNDDGELMLASPAAKHILALLSPKGWTDPMAIILNENVLDKGDLLNFLLEASKKNEYQTVDFLLSNLGRKRKVHLKHLLFSAIQGEATESVGVILKYKPEINETENVYIQRNEFILGFSPSTEIHTPISLAALLGNIDICKQLIEAGANINMLLPNDSLHPLVTAASIGDVDLFKSLMNQKIPEGKLLKTIIESLIVNDSIDLLKEVSIIDDFQSKFTHILMEIMKHRPHRLQGQENEVCYILQSQKNVNEKLDIEVERYCLSLGKYKYDVSMLKAILPYLNNKQCVDSFGKTLLHKHLEFNQSPDREYVTTLIKNGVNPFAIDSSGRTAIDSTQPNLTDEIKSLIEKTLMETEVEQGSGRLKKRI